jgi:hypothetical protein
MAPWTGNLLSFDKDAVIVRRVCMRYDMQAAGEVPMRTRTFIGTLKG